MRTVKVTTAKGEDKVYKNTKHAKIVNGEVAEGFAVEFTPEVVEFESLDEAIASAGDDAALLAYINKSVRSDSIRAASTLDLGSASQDAVRSKIAEITKNATIAGLMTSSRGSKAKENAEALANLKQLAAAGDIEAILKMLQK